MTSKPVNVFLSYASEDRSAAFRLCSELRALGLNVWYDKDSLLPGQDWKRELLRAIRAADFFLVLLSSHSVSKSGVVQREVREAIEVMQERPEGSVFVIPLRLEPVLTTYDALAKIQWVDLFEDRDSSIRSLVETFRVYAGFSPRPYEKMGFDDVRAEVLLAAKIAHVKIYSVSTHAAVASHVLVPREPLFAVLQGLMYNVRLHGHRTAPDGPDATIKYDALKTHLALEISNPCQPSQGPFLPKATAATSILSQLGASVIYEEPSDGIFRARLQLPLSA